MSSAAPTEADADTQAGRDAAQRSGLAAGLLAYGLWGFLPILFYYLEPVGAVTVVAERTFWSLLLVGGILLVTRRLGDVRAAFADPKTVGSLLISALLLGVNWLIYVYAIESEQVLEASFGYFITPLANVAIGMVFLGERQNRAQVLAIAIAVVAIAIQAIGVGKFPFIAVGLAATFAFYGYFRKTAKAGSTTGLFVETLLLAPIAIGYIVYGLVVNGAGPHADPGLMALLIATGPATAIPLLLFAFAVQRLRMTTIGMLQYIAPSIAFVLAITFFGEPLNPLRIVSFVLIWASLAVFTADSYRRRRG